MSYYFLDLYVFLTNEGFRTLTSTPPENLDLTTFESYLSFYKKPCVTRRMKVSSKGLSTISVLHLYLRKSQTFLVVYSLSVYRCPTSLTPYLSRLDLPNLEKFREV